MASPTVGFTAQGTLRVVSPDGREFWRSPRSENRVEYDGMANVLNLGMDVTRRIAGLVDAWVMDLQSLPVARYASGATPAVSGAAADSAMWNVVKYSTVIAEYQRYLEKFPNGVFATLAEQQMRNLVLLGQPEGTVGDKDSSVAGIAFGSYHALIIGINDYKYLPTLETAVNDAQAVSRILKNDYGFKVTTLINASRGEIVEALDEYRETLTADDNLLIYYAGHGWLDEEVDRGYWLPSNAKPNRRTNWVSNATITDTLKSLYAKHVMVIADSCYSGTLTRAAAVGFRDQNYLRRMAAKQARVALVSGGLEPVADKGSGGNSPFAHALIQALTENTSVIDGTRLFSQSAARSSSAPNRRPNTQTSATLVTMAAIFCL